MLFTQEIAEQTRRISRGAVGVGENYFMSENQHDLSHEFPEFKDTIHTLKVSDQHFKKLLDDYHDITKAIHRAEQRIDKISEQEEGKLRQIRLRLKDQLYAQLVREKTKINE